MNRRSQSRLVAHNLHAAGGMVSQRLVNTFNGALELESQRKLHLPCRPRAQSLAERCIRLCASCWVEPCRRIYRIELGMVEYVIDLQPERHRPLVVPQRE